MRVSHIKLIENKDSCELQAQVQSDADNEPFLLWWRFPAAFKRFLSSKNGNPFVAALLLPAMRTGEPLEIPVPVSAKLLFATKQIQDIYYCWDRTLYKVPIKAPIRRRQFLLIRRPSRIGLFFSLGVDSFYTLLKNTQNHSQDNEGITDLIVVHGFDVYFGKWNSELFPTVLSNSTKVAQELGKKVLPVATNIRDFSDRFSDWRILYFGAALASVALALEGMLKKVYIAATHTYSGLFPRGSHPVLDPLWSTEYLSFVHDGCDTERLDKIRFISQYSIALETLRVCFMNPNNEYNCGRCEKCLRTMIGLRIAGALQRCRTLPHIIDLGLVNGISIKRHNESFIEQLINALGSSETDLAIKAALKAALEGCLSKGKG